MNRSKHTRREFLKKSIVIAAAGSAVPYFCWSQPSFANASANDRPGVGCIGMGKMATDWGDTPQHAQFGDILAICDVDSRRTEAAKNNPELGASKADTYGDYRKVLDRNDIDVVSIVTPDHWHVKIAIEALQAGKHVFCQKPLTLTLEENQLIRNACKKYSDKVFIVGSQQRSDIGRFLRAVNMVQKGLLGDIRKITVGIEGSETGGPFPKVAPPKELNWDMWLGQAPKVDYIKERCHFNFRWWYDYSGGNFTDWGAHHVDIATWASQQNQEGMGPIEIDGTNAKHPVPFKDGYPTVDDCYNTSHDFAVKCKFANGIEMIVTSHGDNGILFDGSKGRLFVNRGKITGKPIEEKWDEGKFVLEDIIRLYKGKAADVDQQNFYRDVSEGNVSHLSGVATMVRHKANFYRCIREGGLPISDVFSHVQALNTCHLCAIAARLGRVIQWDPKAEKIIGDDEANQLIRRKQRAPYGIAS